MTYNYPEVIAARELMAEFPARFALRTYPGDRFRLTANATTLFLERVKYVGDRETFEAFGVIAPAELRALIVKEKPMKRTDPYAGPFPRKRHSHRCKTCETRGQINAVACYKSRCTRPQTAETCSWCRPLLPSATYRPEVTQ